MGCAGAGEGGGVLVRGAEVVRINLSIGFFVERNKTFFSTIADKHSPYEQGYSMSHRHADSSDSAAGGTLALPQGSAPGGSLISSSGI